MSAAAAAAQQMAQEEVQAVQALRRLNYSDAVIAMAADHGKVSNGANIYPIVAVAQIGAHNVSEAFIEHIVRGGFALDQVASAFAQSFPLDRIASGVGFTGQMLRGGAANQGAAQVAQDGASGADARELARQRRAQEKALARQQRQQRKAQQRAQGYVAWGDRPWELPTYGGVRQFVADLFVTVVAFVIWRIDAFFTLVWVNAVIAYWSGVLDQKFTSLENSMFRFSWSLLIPVALSFIQRAYWPHRAKRDAAGRPIVGTGTTWREFWVWVAVTLFNVGSTFVGLAIANLPPPGPDDAPIRGFWDTLGAIWALPGALQIGLLLFAIGLAMGPEFLVELFGLRYLKLVKELIGGLWYNAKVAMNWD